eukprot:COSAG06_NODE_53230_length_301_cov_0.767327_1_plen_58_part_10
MWLMKETAEYCEGREKIIARYLWSTAVLWLPCRLGRRVDVDRLLLALQSIDASVDERE